MAATATPTLHDCSVAILCADGVEQVEVTAPRDALREAGATVHVLTPDGHDARGYHYLDAHEGLPADGKISGAAGGNYDVVVVPGGLGSPDTLRTDDGALDFARQVARGGGTLAVICHGPWVLLDAGLLTGRTLTCVPALRHDVENAGATYVDESTHIDDSQSPVVVSGRNFQAADDFAATLVQQLAGGRSS